MSIKRNLVYLRNSFTELIQIVCGTSIMALGTCLFLLHNRLSTGGFSGASTIFYYLFKFPVGTTMFALNIPLFIFCFFKNGKKFFLRSIIGTFFLSFFINIFEKITPLTQDKLLACIYGGILVGIGTAIILKAGASTGGSDLLAQLIRKFNPNYKTGSLIVIFDTIIVGLNVIVFKQIEIALYSAIAIYIMGKSIDIFLEGIYFTKIVYIISDKYEEIASKVQTELERGATGIYAKGMYTQKNKIVLLCVARKKRNGKNPKDSKGNRFKSIFNYIKC